MKHSLLTIILLITTFSVNASWMTISDDYKGKSVQSTTEYKDNEGNRNSTYVVYSNDDDISLRVFGVTASNICNGNKGSSTKGTTLINDTSVPVITSCISNSTLNIKPKTKTGRMYFLHQLQLKDSVIFGTFTIDAKGFNSERSIYLNRK